MISVLLNTAIIVAAFFVMEFVAWFAHKYIMHGFLWSLHRDHHQGSNGFFENNDLFILLFAIPGWLFTMFGVIDGADWKLYAGIGITVYGVAYFLVHDILIHQRFKWFRNWNHPYIQTIRKAHKMHHKHLDKYQGESFGMLLIPKKYWQMAKNKKKSIV